MTVSWNPKGGQRAARVRPRGLARILMTLQIASPAERSGQARVRKSAEQPEAPSPGHTSHRKAS
jgi:hypothetical protein